MSKVLITGANRGIGLALTHEYRNKDDDVIAVCRQSSKALQDLGPTIIDNIDLTEANDRKKLAEKVRNETIDVLINCAGAWCDGSLEHFDPPMVIDNYAINAVSPVDFTLQLLPYMSQKGKVIFITSKMGSIADNHSGGRYGYRMSKAALNAVGKSLSVDLKPYEKSVALIHPGWVQTRMGGPNGLIDAQQSAKGVYNVIEQLTLEQTGQFFNYDGSIIPW